MGFIYESELDYEWMRLGGCPGRLKVASQRVQTQWDDVDIWKRSSEDTTVGNDAKHRQLRSLFGLSLVGT